MLRILRSIAIIALCATLQGCPQAQRPEVPTPPQTIAIPERDLKGATVYQVKPEESLVRILTYKGGALSAAGHNHVIASHNLTGKVYVHEDISHCGFDLVMPVTLLEVDEANLRQEEGEDFKSQVSESAKDGTRKNMLGEALLDGEHYPGVELNSTTLQGTRESMQPTTTAKGACPAAVSFTCCIRSQLTILPAANRSLPAFNRASASAGVFAV